MLSFFLLWIEYALQGFLREIIPQSHGEGDKDQKGDKFEGWHKIQ